MTGRTEQDEIVKTVGLIMSFNAEFPEGRDVMGNEAIASLVSILPVAHSASLVPLPYSSLGECPGRTIISKSATLPICCPLTREIDISASPTATDKSSERRRDVESIAAVRADLVESLRGDLSDYLPCLANPVAGATTEAPSLTAPMFEYLAAVFAARRCTMLARFKLSFRKGASMAANALWALYELLIPAIRARILGMLSASGANGFNERSAG